MTLPKNLVTVDWVAEQLGISMSRVRLHARSGNLKGFKIGQVWVFRKTAVSKFATRPRFPGRPRQARRKT